MRTFDEALKEITVAKNTTDAAAKAERQLEFLPDMAANELFLTQVEAWAETLVKGITDLPQRSADACDVDETEMLGVLIMVVSSVFTWGLNVGRAMESQDWEKIA